VHPHLITHTMTLGEAFALAAAGVIAGLVGTAGGITSLVSYPVLLAAGLAPRAADVANLVALIGCWPGSAAASRQELKGKGRWLARWAPVAAGGAVAGSILLLTTPPGVFARVVPFLVLAGSVSLLLQPRLTRHQRRGSGPVLPAGLVAVSLYNGYFGAGSGVMALALLLITTEDSLPKANALKNMLIGAATLASVLVFATSAPVDWAAAIPLGVGMLAGSTIGPAVTRRIPPGVLRWLVALLGLALAVQLWLGPSW
jgi:uncharacterized protein